MTANEVAKFLKVSRSTVQRWIRKGKLVPATPRNEALERQRPRFRRDDVERLAGPAQ